MPRTVPIGAVITVGGITVANPQTESLAFPPAAKTATGADLIAAGATPEASHYDFAGWSLPVAFVHATNDEARTAIQALDAALHDAMRITFTSGTSVLAAVLREVDAPVIEWTGVGECSATWSGSRFPAFEGASGGQSLTIVDGAATVTVLAAATAGDLIARTSAKVVSGAGGAALNLISVGIEHDPQPGYVAIDSYSGVADLTAHGDAWSATTALDGTYKALGTAPAIDAQGNHGNPYIVARIQCSGTPSLNRYRAHSVISGMSRILASIVGAAAVGTRLLGRVKVPSAPLPDSSFSGSAYGPEAVSASNTVGGTYLTAVYVTVAKIGQTFLHAGGLQTGITMWLKNNSAAPVQVICQLNAGSRPSVLTTLAASFDGPIRFTWSEALPAGQYSAYVQDFGGSGAYNGDGTFLVRQAGAYADGNAFTMTEFSVSTALTSDLYFTAYRRPLITFNATTPVFATGTGTAQLDFVARIPSRSCFIVPTVTGAVQFEGGQCYPHDSVSVIGTAVEALYGDGEFGLAPGVDNAVTAALGVGADGVVVLAWTNMHLGLS